MITIGVVTYNRPEFLLECVNSVLAQSYQDWQVIISNDYLPSPVTFQSLGISQDPRIRIVNQGINLGEIENLNFLLQEASTNFFTWMCDDDLLHSSFLDAAIKGLEYYKFEEPIGFYSDYQTGLNYDIFDKEIEASFSDGILHPPQKFIKEYLSRRIPLIGCYGIVKTSILKKIGGFKRLGNSFGPYSDTILPIKVSQYGPLIYLPSKMVFLRTHQNSLSSNSNDFSAYTSAEDDFIGELKSVGNYSCFPVDIDESVASAVKWFSDNEFGVLMRARQKSTLKVYIRYIAYQFSTSLPRLSFKYKFKHLNHMTRFILSNCIQSVKRRASWK
jgi:glycosyltransferase involved in cell wall biosynthesis